jgi:hypothetical protein
MITLDLFSLPSHLVVHFFSPLIFLSSFPLVFNDYYSLFLLLSNSNFFSSAAFVARDLLWKLWTVERLQRSMFSNLNCFFTDFFIQVAEFSTTFKEGMCIIILFFFFVFVINDNTFPLFIIAFACIYTPSSSAHNRENVHSDNDAKRKKNMVQEYCFNIFLKFVLSFAFEEKERRL